MIPPRLYMIVYECVIPTTLVYILPAENIGCLSGLLIFSVTNNHIEHLPKSMGKLQMLEELSLQ